jgi:hypothetical protein
VYRTTHDADAGTPLSKAVLDALESVDGFDLVDGSTVIYDAVDLDALDALFGRSGSSPDAFVSFPLEGYWITVSAGGTVTVRQKKARP